MLTSKDFIKGGDELRVPIMQQVAKGWRAIFKRSAKLARLLCHLGGSRMLSIARKVDTACAQFNEEEHVDRFQSQGFDCEKVTG